MLKTDEIIIMIPKLKVFRLPSASHLPLPSYQSAGAAGMDLCSAVDYHLNPNARFAVSTGLILEIPTGFEGQIRPRSGLALHHGITCLNSPGTIDWDYRGEIKVILANFGSEAFEIKQGMRIAQLVIAPIVRLEVEEIFEVTSSVRGTQGFGSTGI
jgi:dUTP pyrophosphatase